MRRILDTNVLIYKLNGALDETAEGFLERAIAEDAGISVITRIEVLGWPDLSVDGLRQAQQLLGLLSEHALTGEVAQECIGIRRLRRIKIPDAIIAATALTLGTPLVTRNVGDFRGIRGLELEDPFHPSA